MTLDTELGFPAGASVQTGSEVHPKKETKQTQRAKNIDRATRTQRGGSLRL
jgi:hypothetical protein